MCWDPVGGQQEEQGAAPTLGLSVCCAKGPWVRKCLVKVALKPHASTKCSRGLEFRLGCRPEWALSGPRPWLGEGESTRLSLRWTCCSAAPGSRPSGSFPGHGWDFHSALHLHSNTASIRHAYLRAHSALPHHTHECTEGKRVNSVLFRNISKRGKWGGCLMSASDRIQHTSRYFASTKISRRKRFFC